MLCKAKKDGDVKITLTVDEANFICSLLGDTPFGEEMEQFFNVDTFNMYTEMSKTLGFDNKQYFNITFKEQE